MWVGLAWVSKGPPRDRAGMHTGFKRETREGAAGGGRGSDELHEHDHSSELEGGAAGPSGNAGARALLLASPSPYDVRESAAAEALVAVAAGAARAAASVAGSRAAPGREGTGGRGGASGGREGAKS